ncbi:MAG TPA: LLM class flavin-dependent oxidoreductase [Candidatus Dormibacteraeota bacterium]|nr:LLM class flavin-dependent oxidoreductase [Candidatus Dormibacteraeota bacterium]
MRYCVDIAPLGGFADPRAMARLARTAEASGWDAFSTWDVLATTMGGAADPFVALSAAAATTERIRLIVSVVALARRRPQLVVQAASSLDLLSGGRLVLGVGSGADRPDFDAFDEPFEASERIGRMDEAVDLVDAWLRGETVEHEGRLVERAVAVGPAPLQRPRPPIWFGSSGRPGALRRAARWDGWIAVSVNEDGVTLGLTPDAFGSAVTRLREERAAAGLDGPYEIAVFGQDGLGGARASEFADAGATWWLESYSPMRGSLEEIDAAIAKGPPAG